MRFSSKNPSSDGRENRRQKGIFQGKCLTRHYGIVKGACLLKFSATIEVIALIDACNSALTKGNCSEVSQKIFIGFRTAINCAGIVAGSLAGMLFCSQTSKLGNQCNVVRVSGRRMTNRAPHPSSFPCLKPSSIRISAP